MSGGPSFVVWGSNSGFCPVRPQQTSSSVVAANLRELTYIFVGTVRAQQVVEQDDRKNRQDLDKAHHRFLGSLRSVPFFLNSKLQKVQTICQSHGPAWVTADDD